MIHSSGVGNFEITKLLIEAGSDVNWVSLSGRTALQWAKTVDIARLLIEHRADVNVKDNDEITPLLLLGMQPRPSQTDEERNTHANLLREHGAENWDLFLSVKRW